MLDKNTKLFVFSFVLLTVIISHCVNSLTCGQTECSDGESCCSKEKDGPKICCCKTDIHGFSQHCYSSSGTSSGLAWYGILIIVIVVVGLGAAAVVFFVWYRRRKGYARQI